MLDAGAGFSGQMFWWQTEEQGAREVSGALSDGLCLAVCVVKAPMNMYRVTQWET